jgi:hypothetical protein
MSEHDITLVTSQASTVVAENLKVTLGQARASMTPATVQAMVGIAQGTALKIHPNVTATMAALNAEITNNTALKTQSIQVLEKLTALQTKILPPGNHAAFGQILQQAQSHVTDATNLTNTTNFLANSSYSDFGSGIKDMASLTDRGLSNSLGSLSGAGAALASTGSMFNGISLDNIGKPSGIVEALTNNKLANATGLNQKLLSAGVDINDIHNPAYSDKISSVLSSIKDPTVINVAAKQFGQNPFGGLPSYTGSDSSLYTGAAGKLLGGA